MWRTGLVLRNMWDLPGPGLEPVSPALAGGFLTTAPPGKPYNIILVSGVQHSDSVFLQVIKNEVKLKMRIK